MTLRLLYRGPLSSCNYDCSYCPFAKHKSPDEELERDRQGLARFIRWIEDNDRRPLEILFTPWGEALVRRWYREAMVALSHLPHVNKVAAQTNLSMGARFLQGADLSTAALWVTFHPSEVELDAFVGRCLEAHEMGVRFSVGIVGLREHLGLARQLRAALPDEVYLWVNAFKSGGPGYYAPELRSAFESIDPLFSVNNQYHASLGEPCAAGRSALSIDGEGHIRRCHFVPHILGNIADGPVDNLLRERPCPNDRCGCHIGYVHLDRLRLYSTFEDGVMERIPARRLWLSGGKDDDARSEARALVGSPG